MGVLLVLDIGSVGPEPVEPPDGGCELVALLALEEQLRDFFASALVVGSGQWFFFLFFVFIVDRAEAILGVYFLVLGFRVLGFDFPDVLFL